EMYPDREKCLPLLRNSKGMVIDEVVTEFMSHSEILEPFVVNRRGVTDAEAVAQSHQKARNIWLSRAEWLHNNIELLRELFRPDRQMHAVILDQFFPSQPLNLEESQASNQPEPPFFRSSR